MKQALKFQAVFLFFVLIFLQNGKAQEISANKGYLVMTGEFNDNGATGIYVRGENEDSFLDYKIFIGNNGKVYKALTKEKNIIELFADGEKIPSENFSEHHSSIKTFLENLAFAEELEKLENELDEREEKLDFQENEIDRISDLIEDAQEKIDEYRGNPAINLKSELENLAKLRQINLKLRSSLTTERTEIVRQRVSLSKKRGQINNLNEVNKVLLKLIEDLKFEGLIKNSQALSFKLSNTEFIVNKQRQSAEIHQKFKTKYVINSGEEAGLLYSWKEKL